MDHTSLNEISSLINYQVEAQERLEGCLFKLEALIRVMTLSDSIQHFPPSVIHGHFSVAEDLVERAIQINQECMAKMLRN